MTLDGSEIRREAKAETKPFLHRVFFGDNLFSVILSWVLFFAAIAAAYKVYEIIFGCVDEFGRRYC
ncbi:hypothetical protein LLG90_24540 [Aromatoleum toluclasticum]|uniref:hypothetical protein n=1 Tax=Aromatoleum toluclasticum TaxID=92003 RepID=UPI001D192C53|nr:hypothetical protein [Aromatoleum toluclasticum]MCC4118532.1 hypothetical protein [Aromatoleum toluclasticum]